MYNLKYDNTSNLNWLHVTYIVAIHMCALYALLFDCINAKVETLWLAIILWPISGLGVTAGAHRLWSHRSYSCHWVIRIFLMLAHSCANQLSIVAWTRNHRVHHKYAETNADPHDASKGFWFSHVGHILQRPNKDVTIALSEMDVSDVLADPVALFQLLCTPWIQNIMCFVVPSLFAFYGWQESFWRAMRIAGFLRYVMVLHFTWSVNSFAHLRGLRPYDQTIGAVENKWVSFFALGEGWHNWHHKYPYDYMASERNYNFSQLFIDTFACVGLVYDRKRAITAYRRQTNHHKN